MSAIVNSELIYKEKDLPLGSTRQMAQFESIKGTMVGGSRAIINIPNLRNGFLDTADAFVKFSVSTQLLGANLTNWAGGAANITNPDGVLLSAAGGVSLIRAVEIYSNSAIVARIDNSNYLSSILSVADSSLNSQDAASILAGNSFSQEGDLIGNSVCRTWGYPIADVTGTKDTISTMPTMTFCINSNILSFLGDGCMCPIFAIKNLQLQIEFESDVRVSFLGTKDAVTPAKNCTITGGTNTFSNVAYCAPVVTMDDSSMEAVIKENGFGSRNVMWSGVNHHVSVLQLSVAEQNATLDNLTKLVPANRFTSLKNITLGAFDSPEATGQIDLCIPRISVGSLQYRINGNEYPQQKIDTISKCVQNTIACYSTNSNSVGTTFMNSVGSALNYRQALPTGTQVLSARGVIGLSLETWSESDAVSGLDTTQSDTEALVSTNGATAISNSQLCFVSTYDTVYVVNAEGILSASYN